MLLSIVHVHARQAIQNRAWPNATCTSCGCNTSGPRAPGVQNHRTKSNIRTHFVSRALHIGSPVACPRPVESTGLCGVACLGITNEWLVKQRRALEHHLHHRGPVTHAKNVGRAALYGLQMVCTVTKGPGPPVCVGRGGLGGSSSEPAGRAPCTWRLRQLTRHGQSRCPCQGRGGERESLTPLYPPKSPRVCREPNVHIHCTSPIATSFPRSQACVAVQQCGHPPPVATSTEDGARCALGR